MTLAESIALIRRGSLVQFATPVQILPSQLTAGVEVLVTLPQACDTLWLPPAFVLGGMLGYNPDDVVLGVRINTASAPMLPWGRASFLVSSFSGPVQQLFVTVLEGTPTAPFVLMAGAGVTVTYAGDMVGAGTPDNTTTGGVAAGTTVTTGDDGGGGTTTAGPTPVEFYPEPRSGPYENTVG